VLLADRTLVQHWLLAVLLCALAGCGGAKEGAPHRVVEREGTVGGAEVRLKSELSPARGTLGDPIAWRLTASLGPGAKSGAAFLDPPPAALELDSSKALARKPAQGAPAWAREYVLRGFDLGAIELPRVALVVSAGGRTDTLEFPRDTLFVDSLTQASTGSIRPDRGPIYPPLRPLDYAIVALAVILLAAAIALLIRWLRARRKAREVRAAPSPPDPPEAILGRELDQLERDLATLPRDLFYEKLSLALRSYVAAVTGVPAPDLTTTELSRELTRDRRVISETRNTVIEALRRADLAKFGRFEDEVSEAKSILRQARSVSGRLIARPEPAAAPANGANTGSPTPGSAAGSTTPSRAP
jgi:hypothetical protein